MEAKDQLLASIFWAGIGLILGKTIARMVYVMLNYDEDMNPKEKPMSKVKYDDTKNEYSLDLEDVLKNTNIDKSDVVYYDVHSQHGYVVITLFDENKKPIEVKKI